MTARPPTRALARRVQRRLDGAPGTFDDVEFVALAEVIQPGFQRRPPAQRGQSVAAVAGLQLGHDEARVAGTAARGEAVGAETLALRDDGIDQRVDALTGHATLFIRGDEVEAAWSFVDGIRAGWEEASPPVRSYAPGSRGPEAADALFHGCEGTWSTGP